MSDLGAAISGLASHAAAQDERLRVQLNALGQRFNSLAEQMEIQWWVSNGYSLEQEAPFSKMAAGEIAVRAARELRHYTRSEAGVHPAPALLDKVLQDAKASKTQLTLADLAIASPIDWRRKWVGELPAAPNASLFPVAYASLMATEADDNPDWYPRFERETNLSTKMKLSPLEWANQLYREFIAIGALD
ncbi:hypothetical protein D3C72_345110 [compost metagenome]